MIFHIFDFIIDYFTNLNARKIFGGILVLIGWAIVGRVGISSDMSKGVLIMCGGLLISGIGLAVIYYDMAQDKIGRGRNDLEMVAKAYKQKELEERKVTGWRMDDDSPSESDKK